MPNRQLPQVEFVGTPYLSHLCYYAKIAEVDHHSEPGKRMWSQFGNLTIREDRARRFGILRREHKYVFLKKDDRWTCVYLRIGPETTGTRYPVSQWYIVINPDQSDAPLLLPYREYMMGQFDDVLEEEEEEEEVPEPPRQRRRIVQDDDDSEPESPVDVRYNAETAAQALRRIVGGE